MSVAGDIIEMYRDEHEQIAYCGDDRRHRKQRKIRVVVLNKRALGVADIADYAENRNAYRRGEGVLYFSREAHYREHDSLDAAACFPLDVVDGLGLHLLLHEVLELKRNSRKTRKEDDEYGREYRRGLTLGLVYQSAVGGQSKEQMKNYSG